MAHLSSTSRPAKMLFLLDAGAEKVLSIIELFRGHLGSTLFLQPASNITNDGRHATCIHEIIYCDFCIEVMSSCGTLRFELAPEKDSLGCTPNGMSSPSCSQQVASSSNLSSPIFGSSLGSAGCVGGIRFLSVSSAEDAMKAVQTGSVGIRLGDMNRSATCTRNTDWTAI
jgi:hypothetical protein